MEVIKCSRGHYYDSALGYCPVCSAEAGGSDNAGSFFEGNDAPDDIPATAPASSFAGETDFNRTMPVTDAGFTPTDFTPSSGDNNGWEIDDYEPTKPDTINDIEGFDPIVGWLICVKGPNRGRDYRLHSGTNFIGRSKEMDICIENDQTISKRNAASISYDDRTKAFFIEKGEVRNLIYLNGKSVRSDADIVIYDRIEIGSTELIFVPLCGEKFNWQDN